MVGTGQPQRTVALHALKAREDILQRSVHRVPHMELTCDVRGRHDDGKRLFVGVRLRLEAVMVHPQLIDAAFHLLRVIHFR